MGCSGIGTATAINGVYPSSSTELWGVLKLKLAAQYARVTDGFDLRYTGRFEAAYGGSSVRSARG